jgi:hypothetical protein
MSYRPAPGRIKEFILGMDKVRRACVCETNSVFRAAVGGKGKFRWTICSGGEGRIGGRLRCQPEIGSR